jgi:hypothetical protein
MTGTTSAGPSMSTTMCASRSPSATVPFLPGGERAHARVPRYLTVYGPVGTA